MGICWKTIKSAPKDGKPFVAWYESEFGPPFGTMMWCAEPKGNGGRFHSATMGTQTKYATHWMVPNPPILSTSNPEKEKRTVEVKYPSIDVQLTGEDGNAFAILGACQKAARRGGVPKEKIDEFRDEATAGDYNHLLGTAMKWFNVS